MDRENARRALNVKLPESDPIAWDVAGYLGALLEKLLIEEDGFSGKRPFGNSGWLHDITEPLRDAGFDPDEGGFFTDLVNALCCTEDYDG